MIYEIGDIFLYYVIDLIKLMLVIYGILALPFSSKKRNYIITGTIVIFIIIVVGTLDHNGNISERIISLLVIATLCSILKGKIIKKVFTILLVYICVLFIDVCITGIISLFFNMKLENLLDNKIISIFCNGMNIVTISFVVLIKKWHRSSIGSLHISRRIYALLFTGTGTGSIFIASLMLYNIQGATEKYRRSMLAITIIICFVYFTVCFLLVFTSEARDNYRALAQINQTVIESQQKYYLLAQEKQQEIRSIRHEIKNHLACINGLYRNEKLQEMGNYINQVIEEAETLPDFFDTGNDIVDAILNDAEGRYQKDGIGIRHEGMFPKELYISPMDLCVIFANAVANAVEALQRLSREPSEQCFINIKISSYKEDLYIDIWNPIAQKVEISNGTLMTTKQDKNSHGFGTKNIKQRVEKYQGTLEFESCENLFYVHIFMKNRKEKGL